MDIIQAYKNRRSQYALSDELALNKEQVNLLIKDAVRESPSAFNSQSSRVVILHGAEHTKLWQQIVLETLRPLTNAKQFENTKAKIDSFAAAAGTVLFFEDQNVIQGLQQQFPTYADKFPEFSANSAGIAQFAVWVALSEQNIGASLQHYNPLIDQQVKETWHLPDSWQLSAQMPFGKIVQPAGAKEYMDDAERFRILG